MKYSNPVVCSIPFLNTETDGTVTRNWARMTFTPNEDQTFDRRFVKREIRKWIKRNLSRAVRTDELRAIVRNVREITPKKAEALKLFDRLTI